MSTIDKSVALNELREQLAVINRKIQEAQTFANENGLAIGQPRYNLGHFECKDPDQWTDSGCSVYEDDPNWIGSQVCW